MNRQLQLRIAQTEDAPTPVELPLEVQESLVALLAEAIVTLIPASGGRGNEQSHLERED